MRRLIGLVLSSVGTFLIVLALLVHFVVPGRAVKFPLNVRTVTTLQGAGVSYFSAAKLHEITGATVRTTDTLKGFGGDASDAVWREFTYVFDQSNSLPVNYSLAQLAFDRRSGVLVNCCGINFGGNSHVHVSGQGPVFPIGTEQRTYQVFNSNLLKAAPARYMGQRTIDGLNTYGFIMTVPPTMTTTVAVPGFLIGQKKTPVVRLGQFYQGRNIWWVDPVTGIPVALDQYQHVTLRDASGTAVLDAFNGDQRSTAAGTRAAVSYARSQDALVQNVSLTLPLIFGLVGLVVLGAGLFLYLTGRDPEEYQVP